MKKQIHILPKIVVLSLGLLVLLTAKIGGTAIKIDAINPKPVTPKLKDFWLINELYTGESSRSFDTINNIGALGGWGMMPKTLLWLKIDTANFRQDSVKQVLAVQQLIDTNRYQLKLYIKHFSGKSFRGVEITETGILAAAHLAGVTGVKRWFDYGINARDINGASIEGYLKRYAKTNN